MMLTQQVDLQTLRFHLWRRERPTKCQKLSCPFCNIGLMQFCSELTRCCSTSEKELPNGPLRTGYPRWDLLPIWQKLACSCLMAQTFLIYSDGPLFTLIKY